MNAIYLTEGSGTYLESILNATIAYYNSQKKGLFWKNNPNYLLNNSTHNFQLINTTANGCDYSGLWQGHFLEFEAKSTIKNYFNLRQLSHYQITRLKTIHEHKGVAFVIIYFIQNDTYFAVSYLCIAEAIKNKQMYLDENWCKEKGCELFILHPLHLSIFNYLFN